jgi:hypothetical protein
MTRRADEAGFTLIEAIAVIAVTAVIGMGVASMILVAAEAQATAVDLADVTDVGTIASNRLYTELREMQLPPALGLQSLSASELRFTDSRGVAIAYALSGTTLTRSQSGGAAQVFAEGVEAFAVTYRRGDGSPAASAAEVARIDFALTLRRGEMIRRFGGQVWPRASVAFIADWREE